MEDENGGLPEVKVTWKERWDNFETKFGKVCDFLNENLPSKAILFFAMMSCFFAAVLGIVI